MSARKIVVLFTLLFALGVLFTLPSSSFAAETRPVHPQITQTNRPPADELDEFKKSARKAVIGDEEGEEFLLERNEDFLSKRLSGDEPLNIEEAAAGFTEAQITAERMRASFAEKYPNAYGGEWEARGPDTIVQIQRSDFSFAAVSGRIGGATILPNGRRIIGGAQGGIWVWEEDCYCWNPRTDNIGSLAIGSLAYAPSNPNIVYAGTGEGHLSGDSYAGNGILKSPDGGYSWYRASGNSLLGVSISKLIVDPNDENHLYAAVLRGRGGSRRVTRPPNTAYGIYESTDGAISWTLKKGGPDGILNSATDLVADPQNFDILYASFWGDKIYKSTNGGNTWAPIMNGFPVDADYGAGLTRFALTISHPDGMDPVLYTGFDYFTTGGAYVQSRVWKSVDEGATWTLLPAGTLPNKVQDYCGGQCFYDNYLAAAPDDPNVVFALGQFDYSLGSGGIFRSDDGGMTWKNLGWNQHPDFQVLAFNPSNTMEVMYGSDGGVWVSSDRGGRPNISDPLSDVTWENLNGVVDPDTSVVYWQTGLQITQFTSVQTVPYAPNRLWGGSQDNGTERRFNASNAWVDAAFGDGGQALVDPDGGFLYNTYFGITPYRFDIRFGLFIGGNESIANGIDTTDRAEFYIPMTMNDGNPDQLFLGTYRLYRTDNARADSASDVTWKTISGDLTTGCPGTAPNGARGCFISAIAVSQGGRGGWVGTDDGLVQYAPNITTAAKPRWKNVTKAPLPNRPVTSIAVDQSNARVAIVAYGGFNKATPGAPGHLFKTTNAGRTWTNISGNLPNVPFNSVLMDPSYSDTIYVGTDVGPFVSTDGGNNWAPLGSGHPIVAVWQLDIDPANRILASGTHGRGAFRLVDSETTIPALVLSKVGGEEPVGPDTDVTLYLTVKNIGNADATGVQIRDKLPKNTTFVSASDGGSVKKGFIRWNNLTVPAGESKTVSVTLHIASNATKRITNKNYSVTSAEGVGARGTPRPIKLAPPNKTMLTPHQQLDGTRVGNALDYQLAVQNLGYEADSYKINTSGNSFTTQVFAADCATPLTDTSVLSPGAVEWICVNVAVPGGASDGTQDTVSIVAKSNANGQVKDTATITTIAVTDNILLLDADGNIPNTRAYYTTALDSYGQPYNVWDLNANPVIPQNYLNAHATAIFYTGNVWPQPMTPYETNFAAYLDNGGNLFITGQDILDQNGGTSSFVHDYLKIDWDGSEAQNDKGYEEVDGVGGNPVTGSFGNIALDLGILGNGFNNWITPIAPAEVAFTTDDTGGEGTQNTALTYDAGTYKVMFMAFAFEEFGSASDKATLMANVLDWFGVAPIPPVTDPKQDSSAPTQGNQQNKKQDKKSNASSGNSGQ